MTEWGDARPPYMRIADTLRAQIEAGELAPGAPIPSVNRLMADYGVSNSTAQRAIRHLKAAGLVETRLGRGIFVRERRKLTTKSSSYLAPPAEAEPVPYRGRSTDIEVREEVPPDDVAEALGLDVDEPALRRYRVIVDSETGEPYEIVVSYYRPSLATDTALAASTPIPGGAHAELERLGVRLRGDAIDRVTAWMPTAHETRTLRLPPNTPVLHILRTVFDTDGNTIEVEHSTYSADRYAFEYTVRMHG
jgi:GntR family transcriptional regulator